jgi:hypothetical protein
MEELDFCFDDLQKETVRKKKERGDVTFIQKMKLAVR